MSRIIVYTGKGGVGKTSVAAATGLLAAERGYRTIVLSTDAAHTLADSFDTPLGPEPTLVGPNLWGQESDVSHNIAKYWDRTRLILDATSQEAPVRRSGHGGFGYLLGAASIRRLSVRHGSSARLDPVTHVAGARRIGTRADQARIEGQRDVSSSRRVRGRGYFVDRDGVRRIEPVRPAIGQPDSERISHNGGGGQSDPEPAGLGRLSGCRP